MAQLINITSEALQATIRRLLPSQQGFGEDLQASNVITPIIDLTPTAEGSEVRADLQRAFSLNSITAFSARNSTETIANTPGFYRVRSGISVETSTTSSVGATFQLTDGTTTKIMFRYIFAPTVQALPLIETVDFDVFLGVGESLQASSNDAVVFMDGCSWQIADAGGNLNNPSGFTPQ